MTHLECNPQVVDQLSSKGGLHWYESEVQMGISQSHLRPIPQSLPRSQISDPQRVLPGVWLQSQIRYPAAQWSSTTKAQATAPNTSPDLRPQGDLCAQPNLGKQQATRALNASGLFCLCGFPGPKNISASLPKSKTNCFPSAPLPSTAGSKPKKAFSKKDSTAAPRRALC